MGTKLSATIKSSQAGTAASAPPSKLTWAPLLSIASAAFAIEIPFFFLGTPSGHDVEFHLYSWLEVLSQCNHGVVYPCLLYTSRCV